MASSGNPNNPPPPSPQPQPQPQLPLYYHQFYHPTTFPSSSHPPPTLPYPFHHHLQPHPPQPPQLQYPPLQPLSPPALQQHQHQQPSPQQQHQQQPSPQQFHHISALLSQRSLPFPTPPQPPNPNPNFSVPHSTPGPDPGPGLNTDPNAGARLMALLGSLPQPLPPSSSGEFLWSGPPADPLPLAPAWMVSSEKPCGRRLSGDYVACDVDARDPTRPPPQLEVTPITKYVSDPQLVLGRQNTVNQSYICYGLKQGNIRMAKEKGIKYYSSSERILLVGEGDFSFAVSLARDFGSAANIVATALDSRERVLAQYSRASENLKELEELGCDVVHKVNAHTMSEHPLLRARLFDKIVFNFPHAGFLLKEDSPFQIKWHQDLVRAFFKSASGMLALTGEVHVTHKTAYPFSAWNIVSLAMEFDLSLVRKDIFHLGMYPGYLNKRGEGHLCDSSFPVGLSSTYKFALR